MTYISISQLCRELGPLVPLGPQMPISGNYMAMGPRALPSWFLRRLAPALGRGMRTFWVDGGNNFDAYGVSRTAKALGFDPKRSLNCINLVRPFNAYQLETILTTKLPAVWRGEPIVLSDPLAPLLDEETPAAEARKVFPRILAAMKNLPAVWLTLCVQPREVAPDRRSLVEEFVRQGSAFARLEDHTDPWKLLPVSEGALNLDQAFALDHLLSPTA